MIAIPNMDMPKEPWDCCSRNAETGRCNVQGIDCDYYIPKDCPLIDIVTCGECKHRDPEDKKCDSGMFERQGCIFPVDDDYFCKYGERRNDDSSNMDNSDC